MQLTSNHEVKPQKMKKFAFQIMANKATTRVHQQGSGTAQLTIHPLAEQFPDLPVEDFDKLKASILDIGLIDPLVINDQGQILDGRRKTDPNLRALALIYDRLISLAQTRYERTLTAIELEELFSLRQQIAGTLAILLEKR